MAKAQASMSTFPRYRYLARKVPFFLVSAVYPGMKFRMTPHAPAGSLSHPTANKIYIIKRGEKFPPLKYDADVSPAFISDSDPVSRRSGDNMQTKKYPKVTKVKSLSHVNMSYLTFQSAQHTNLVQMTRVEQRLVI